MSTAEPRWLDAQERETWLALASVLMRLPAELDRQLQRDAGLSHFEYQVLAALSGAEDRTLRMGTLAELTEASLPRLSQVVSRLEQRGWVRRAPDPSDGRCTLALLTDTGWEKLVPTLADAAAQIRLLARSGTGQEITSYTTFLTGPEPGRELHLVLLDNGRSELWADPAFRPALRCIRCAACADVCPPYQVVGGHVFGYVYSGAIGLVNTPFHHGLQADAAIHAVRGLRAIAHGFATIEQAGGFGLAHDRDESFLRLVRAYIAGLRAQ